LFQCFVAREKLDIPAGNKLVVEENGNEIDEDDVLLLMLEEHRILLLLCNGERWRPGGGTRPTCLTVFIPALTGLRFWSCQFSCSCARKLKTGWRQI